MAKLELAYKTNQEALAAWDANRPVWTCEMGGIGPGYEQVIHMMAFEMLRSMLQHPAPPPLEEEPELPTIEAKVARLDADKRTIAEIIEAEKEKKEAHKKLWREYSDLIEATPNVKAVIEKLGPTGAQFGAAMNLASVFAINGYEKAIEMIPDNRAILVQKEFVSV